MARKVFGRIAALAWLAALAIATPATAPAEGGDIAPLGPKDGGRVALPNGFLLGPYALDGVGTRHLVDDRGAPLDAASDFCFLTSVDDRGGRWMPDGSSGRIIWEDPSAHVWADPVEGGRWTLQVRGHPDNRGSAYCITQTRYPGSQSGRTSSAAAPILLPAGRDGAMLVGRDNRDIQPGDSFLIPFTGNSPDLWALLEGDTQWNCAQSVTEVDRIGPAIVEEGASDGGDRAASAEHPGRVDAPSVTVGIVTLEHSDPASFGVSGQLSVSTRGHRDQIIRGISFTCAIARAR